MKENRITKILGIKYPIIQEPMAWLTDAKLVAAVSNAGGLGILGPSAGQTTMTPSPQETMESEFFEEWFREILLRNIEKLGKRVLIVMDNARFHRKNILEKIIKETGHYLLFLPLYSPDLNPIEKLWANMKKKLKDIAHNFNTLLNKLYYK